MNKVVEELFNQCDFVLHGHFHFEMDDQVLSTVSSRTVVINNRLTHDLDLPNGYNWVQLDFSQSEAMVYRRNLTADGEWGPDPRISDGSGKVVLQFRSCEPSRSSGSPTPETERVATHADNPAFVDELGRRPFAEVIGQRLEEVWDQWNEVKEQNGDRGHLIGAFMVHIHGPWGSGKTSVLNFLRTYLQDNNRPHVSQWVAVEFNAWKQQRIRPPWWTLIKEVVA